MRIKSIHFHNFRRFTDLTVEDIPEEARLILLAGPNGAGKSSFFDGLVTWYRRSVWNTTHGSEEYSAKVGMTDTSQYYDRVTVELHGPPLARSDLQRLSVYFRSAYRHEVEFKVQQLAQQASPVQGGGTPRRAVDTDKSVSENYQRLLWQTFSAVFDEDTPEATTKAEIRDELTGRLRESLLRVLPDLTLSRVGGISAGHSFEFTKGAAKGFPYVNLSAGEKAVFDLLLDAVVKAEFYQDAVWCIDEPEVHIGTKAQGLLLRELLALLPAESQLFLASHSVGLMTEAVKLAKLDPEEVGFLDFGQHDFDTVVTMQPTAPTREFWKRILTVALEDIALLVAPSTLVLCEGSAEGFDAKCYRTIFGSKYPDVDFVSVGNSHDTQHDKINLTSTLQTIAEGTSVTRLRDRDLATDDEVREWSSEGVRALGRRHVESYLYDLEVLEALCDSLDKAELKPRVAAIRETHLQELISRGKDADDVKAASGLIFTDLRKLLAIPGAGTTARAFAQYHLAPLIQPHMKVYRELESSIFGGLAM